MGRQRHPRIGSENQLNTWAWIVPRIRTQVHTLETPIPLIEQHLVCRCCRQQAIVAVVDSVSSVIVSLQSPVPSHLALAVALPAVIAS